MNGTIRLESGEGEGTRFTIKLNLQVARSETSTSIAPDDLKRALTIASYNSSTSIKTIVVLSDVYTVRLIKTYLQSTSLRIKAI